MKTNLGFLFLALCALSSARGLETGCALSCASPVDELLPFLASDEAEVRDRASAGLVDLGPRARPALERARLAHDDPEVRLRLGNVLERWEQGLRALDDLYVFRICRRAAPAPLAQEPVGYAFVAIQQSSWPAALKQFYLPAYAYPEEPPSDPMRYLWRYGVRPWSAEEQWLLKQGC
ncbi:MAG: hypothetical protein M5U26_26045 [Planctomycetota bacterium]|nr:hypothetical protein [Planctomycetota bacterium]